MQPPQSTTQHTTTISITHPPHRRYEEGHEKSRERLRLGRVTPSADEVKSLARSVLGRSDARVFRPLVEEPLWSRGIKAVTSGRLGWDRLRDRYLDDEFAEFRPGRDRFLVGVVGPRTPRTPARRSSQVSPPSDARRASPVRPFLDDDLYEPVTRPASPRRQLDGRQAAILERATTAWLEKTGHGDETVLTESLKSPVGGRYVAALRAARRDVDRLRGARTIAGLLEDGTTRRTLRRFRRRPGRWKTGSRWHL